METYGVVLAGVDEVVVRIPDGAAVGVGAVCGARGFSCAVCGRGMSVARAFPVYGDVNAVEFDVGGCAEPAEVFEGVGCVGADCCEDFRHCERGSGVD